MSLHLVYFGAVVDLHRSMSRLASYPNIKVVVRRANTESENVFLLVLRWLMLGDRSWRILSCLISASNVLFLGVYCSPHLTMAVRELCS
jgi:hypothetical protein